MSTTTANVHTVRFISFSFGMLLKCEQILSPPPSKVNTSAFPGNVATDLAD